VFVNCGQEDNFDALNHAGYEKLMTHPSTQKVRSFQGCQPQHDH